MKINNFEKIERYLFYIFLFSIPLQTRKFLYSVGAVEGFNEWQSVFLYGTDLLIFGLFILWVKRTGIKNLFHAATRSFREIYPRSFTKNDNDPSGSVLRTESFFYSLRRFLSSVAHSRLRRNKFLIPALLLSVFLLAAFLSIFSASYGVVAGYRFLRLLMFVFLAFYVVSALKNKVVNFSGISLAFVAGGLFQSFIAIGQFIAQRSLGLRILGESYLAPGRQEVAEIIAFGGRFIRAYGTLPSPNVLAAFLAMSLLFLVGWFLHQKQPLSSKKRILTVLAGIVMGSGLFFTFSRAVFLSFAAAFLVFIIIILWRKQLRVKYAKPLFLLMVPLLIAAAVLGGLFWPEVYSRIFTTFDRGDHALRERVFFNDISYQVIADNELLGAGIGNYTLYVRDIFSGLRDSLYQPVHNIFLLITSEIGAIGAVAFALFLMLLFVMLSMRLAKNSGIETALLATLLVFILVSGLFDHFYWTLQQGSLMLWFVVGLACFYILRDDNLKKNEQNGAS